MSLTIAIPLDLPDVTVLSHEMNQAGHWLITVESTLNHATCRKCGRTITAFHGHDDWITLRHLSILGHPVFLRLRPKRYQCPSCAGKPTTTQQLAWADPNTPQTSAYARSLLLQLINSTIEDVCWKERIGYDAVVGVVDRYIGTQADWTACGPLGVLGLDEIALKKGHRDFVVIVTARGADGRTTVLAVVPDRKKETVKQFLQGIPPAMQATIQTVCTEMYDGYITAVNEALPGAMVVVDRFHVAKAYRDAADTLRKQEVKRLKKELPQQDADQLKGTLWAFRKNQADLEADEATIRDGLLMHSPALQQAYTFREDLTAIFEQPLSKAEAIGQIQAWQARVRASGLTCFDSFLTTLDNWLDEITNYFVDRQTSGFVEGLNNKIKVIKRRCYGIFNIHHLFQRIYLDLEGYRLFRQSCGGYP
jgi:transposase